MIGPVLPEDARATVETLVPLVCQYAARVAALTDLMLRAADMSSFDWVEVRDAARALCVPIEQETPK